jgi:hypothetical protein
VRSLLLLAWLGFSAVSRTDANRGGSTHGMELRIDEKVGWRVFNRKSGHLFSQSFYLKNKNYHILSVFYIFELIF